jgi:hypothetical protein
LNLDENPNFSRYPQKNFTNKEDEREKVGLD